MDSDLSIYSSQVPFSVVQQVERVIQECVGQWMKGSIPHHQDFTLEGGYTGLVISKSYKEKLSAEVQEAVQIDLEKFTQTAIEREKEYEENK